MSGDHTNSLPGMLVSSPRRFGRAAFLAVLLVLPPTLLMCFIPAAASASVGTAFPVNEASGSDKHQSPAIGGRIVAWEDDRNNESNIRARDLDTRAEFEIATGVSVKRDPVTNGRFVFWEDDRNGDSDIYGARISNGSQFVLAGGPGEQRKPQVEGDTVVWQSKNAEGKWQVYSVDLASYQPTPDTSPSGKVEATGGDTMMNPVISDQFIVWEEIRDGTPGIYTRDRQSGEERKVAEGFGVGAPAVSGSIVAWQDSDGGTFDIFGRDLHAKNLQPGETFTIAGGAGDQVAPAIGGKLVVWQDGPNDTADIRGRDLETGDEFLIAGGDGTAHNRPAVSGDTVVWQGSRLSESPQPDGTTTTNLHLDILGAELDLSPAAPRALKATGSLDGVALEWRANTESDLAGYNVYRSGSADGAYTKLNDAPLDLPSYDDLQAPKGAKSSYQVAAVDASGKESVRAGASSAAQLLAELGLGAGTSTLNAGESLELSGKLSSGGNALSGKTVELFERPAGASQWTETVNQPAPTGPDGGFSVTGVQPGKTTEYRAQFAGEPENGVRSATSAVQQVRVKQATSLSLGTSRATLVAGQGVELSGKLASGGAALSGERVLLMQKPAGAASFSRVPGQPTAGMLTGADGEYRLAGIKPQKNTVYRAMFGGAPELQPAASATRRVNVKARVITNVNATTPAVSIRGKVVTAKNGLVRVTIKKNGKVVAKKTVKLANSRYRTSYRAPGKGKYTITASVARDFDNLGNVSPVREFSRG